MREKIPPEETMTKAMPAAPALALISPEGSRKRAQRWLQFASAFVFGAALFACGGGADPGASNSARVADALAGTNAPVDVCHAPALSTVLSPVPAGGGGGSGPVDVKIHYNRPDGTYTGWGLHLWQIDAGNSYIADYPGVSWPLPLPPAGTDSYGPFFIVSGAAFGASAAGFGFIVHNGDTKDPDGDRFWKFSDGNEFWLKSGDSTIYRSNPLAGTLDLTALRVHYKRYDNGYAQWGLHLWDTSRIDVARLPGVTIGDWNSPVPLSSMPNYTAAADGSEVAFDLPLLNPAADATRTSVEFIIHGLPSNPNGGVNNKDGWSNNIHVNYSALSIVNQVGPIWLVQEDPTVYSSLPNTHFASTTDARAIWLNRSLLKWPKVDSSGVFKLYYSTNGQIVAQRGQPVGGADGALDLQVFSGTVPADVATRFKYVGAGVTLSLVNPLALDAVLASELVVVQQDANGNVQGATTTQLPGLLDDRFAAAANVNDLGVTPGSGRARFKLWAPTAQKVTLCTYGVASAADTQDAMQFDAATGVWKFNQLGDRTGRYYRYAVEVFVRGVGVVRNLVTDPYSISLDANSLHSYVGDLSSHRLKPAGWDEQEAPETVKAQEDMTVYELHVRDFSANDATVSPAHRGKYLAFTESASNGMQHLSALARAGVTDVHLLPSFDIATVPEIGCVTPAIPNSAPDSPDQQAAVAAVRDADCFNWGYDPFHYTAPEGSYATDASDGAVRVREFRAMVQALHAAGLRVGMDVVYNHTSASGQDDHSVLDRVVPGYYQRLNASGQLETSTCCANTATENLMMGKLMIDSVQTWATQYKIDSFRFDLMGHQPRAVMEKLKADVNRAVGHDVPLIGEGWNFGEVADGARFVQASQLSLNGSGIGTFSDRARDYVRGGGPFDGGSSLVSNQGYINGEFYDVNEFNASGSGATKTKGDLMWAGDVIKSGLAGSIRDYTITTSWDATLQLQQLDYNGQPMGYVTDPQEVVNYVENHDNQTLFDINVYKLPVATTREDRARVQMLGAAIVAFSQGVAYYHAGVETLRSKSMDRNSYNSGDWFNKLDWSLNDNNFGVGLPMQGDNGDNWSIIGPLLANSNIKPGPAQIAWASAQFQDLMRIRSSSRLFHLRTAAEIKQRLTFYNTGSNQVPTVLVGHLDGRSYSGAEERDLMYFINVDKVAQSITIAAESGKEYRLHRVHRSMRASDQRAASATYNAASGTFMIPARTAVVFVVD